MEPGNELRLCFAFESFQQREHGKGYSVTLEMHLKYYDFGDIYSLYKVQWSKR